MHCRFETTNSQRCAVGKKLTMRCRFATTRHYSNRNGGAAPEPDHQEWPYSGFVIQQEKLDSFLAIGFPVHVLGDISNNEFSWPGETRTMWQRLVFLFGGFLVTTLFAVAGEKAPNDAKDLQGTWQVIDLEANGEKKPANEFEGWNIIIKGDEIWLEKPTGVDPKLKYKLDPTKKPKTIDLTVQEGKDKGKVVLGIYSLEKGQLRLCINTFGDPSFRPKEFKTHDKDGVGFATLKRIKAK